jgi:TPR repeat protein
MLMELGNIYFYGKECDPDYKLARKYYSLAAKQEGELGPQIASILDYMNDNSME